MSSLYYRKCATAFVAGVLLLPFFVDARPARGFRADQTRSDILRTCQDLRLDLDNYEMELRTLNERLAAQEVILDAFRQQLAERNQTSEEKFKEKAISFEKQILTLNSHVIKLTEDVSKIQEHANEMAKVFGQYKQKIVSLEKQFTGMEKGLQGIVSELSDSEEHFIYKVCSGDTLEKIANKHRTSVTQLKKTNGLSGDRIYCGQKLKIP